MQFAPDTPEYAHGDRSFEHCAAKVSKEPILPDAAVGSNGSYAQEVGFAKSGAAVLTLPVMVW